MYIGNSLERTCKDYRKYKPKVRGGIGKKDSNSNRQWKMQNRVYECIIAVSLPTSFHPYYAVPENKECNEKRIP